MKKVDSTNRKKANVPAQKKLEQLELFPKVEMKAPQKKPNPFVSVQKVLGSS
jgi:hypothetical protein